MTEESKKYKVIIVDDDAFLVNMYALKFSKSGVEVIACRSGDEVLEKLRQGQKVDLILLDVVIPGMDGITILENIRKEKLSEGVPIVMLTNQNDEKDIGRANNLGVAGYIVKATMTPSEVVDETLSIIKDNKKS
jgi:DNA-binding response OmpR family regulator